jgi:8-amino-7-oxononanoate synthase
MRRDEELLRRELAALEDRHGLRRRRLLQAFPQAGNPTRVRLDGRTLINFCSNDYLGLSHHPALARAQCAAAEQFGAGSGASHLVSGHSFEHHALEEELAAFAGRERALLFSTGYMANLGAVTALAGRGESVLADRWSHASLLDAAQLSGARLRRYAHADPAAAARACEHDPRVSLIATDGVFSMDGDLAPLPALAALARQQGAWLLVDDAHGLGVLGPHGRGTLELQNLDAAQVPILVGTLGKAFGSFGAFVAGEATLIEYLLQRARSYIYTTALPPAVAAATRAALRLVQSEPWRRERLRTLIQRFRAAATGFAARLRPSETPIQPVIVGDAAQTLALSASLAAAGFFVAAIRPPTVPAGSARLRITLSAAHTEADVDALAAELTRLLAAADFATA